MTEVVTFTKQGSIGVIALNNPPVNALSHAVRSKLLEVCESAFADTSISALLLCCEGRTFVAGADIREFGKPPRAPDLPEVVEFLERARLPVIAAIQGSALGGGLELALACHFRVALGSARVGLPEVTLGILPGAGGTQRLPRLVGVRAALDMIVSGVPISAASAYRLGLIDEVVDGDLRAGALAFAQRVVAEQRAFRRVSELTAKLDEPDLLERYEASTAEKKPGLLAPLHCIQAVRAAIELPFADGLKRERELFVELMASPQAKALQHAFFGEREVAKVPGVPNDTPAREIGCAAVVGAGATGASIAMCFADARISVRLLDATQAELDRGLATIREHYADAVARDRLRQAQMDERLSRIRPTLSFDDLEDTDLVIEASCEELAAAREVFAKLDAVCKPTAILATNASGLDIDQLAATSMHPHEVMGMHFFTPVDQTRLLENVRGRRTAPEVCATAMKLGKLLGKIPVLVRASAGLVGERMLARQFREAFFLIEEGALPAQVDRVLCAFGFTMGPFMAIDLAGLDVAWCRRNAHFERLTPREKACNILEKVCEQGRLGQKTGDGFYRYDSELNATSDPAIEELIVKHSRERGISRRTISDREVLERCLYCLIDEGARILEQGIVARPLEIDMIWIHGYGFPVHRGGPMFYADQNGLRVIYQSILEHGRHAGAEYWTPAPLLERLANEGQGFYGAS
jgi:3-hydroxyacyl-CoA dehydrogenase